MKVFLDSNVLLSAALWPGGATAACYALTVTLGHDVVVSDYVLDEVLRVASRKFPDKARLLEEFLVSVVEFASLVSTPDVPDPGERLIRDHSDRPVLRGARASDCVLSVTGDKDLLQATINAPEVVTPAEYLRRHRTD